MTVRVAARLEHRLPDECCQRDDLFNINAGIVKSVCEVRCVRMPRPLPPLRVTRAQGIVKACPCALVNVISNPVNSTVPIAAEVFKKAGTFDPRRLFGAASSSPAEAALSSPAAPQA